MVPPEEMPNEDLAEYIKLHDELVGLTTKKIIWNALHVTSYKEEIRTMVEYSIADNCQGIDWLRENIEAAKKELQELGEV